ncbi:MAG TPA: hypothetical protein VJV78_46995 [Polyangiales bacterium]|nr:hypothetical protein [Polyangiales bacterium]
MSVELKPAQATAIYALVFATTEEQRRPYKSQLEPLKAKDRNQLIQLGLLEIEKVKPQGERVCLTDKGWAWAAEHLGSTDLTKARVTVRTLQAVLLRLRDHLAANDASLASFVAPEINVPPQLGARIRNTCLDLGQGVVKKRVRLRELRDRLADVPRARLDGELVRLQDAGALVLYRIDDPTDIAAEDERAALHVAGAPHHILYLEH